MLSAEVDIVVFLQFENVTFDYCSSAILNFLTQKCHKHGVSIMIIFKMRDKCAVCISD